MKRLLIILLLGIVTVANAMHVNVNENAVKKFKEVYPDAQKIVWGEYPNYSQVSFETEGLRNIISYDAEGEVISAQRFYMEKYLPPYILLQVKKKYSGKNIFGVTEVSNENGIKYFLILSDDKNWYNVECDSYGNLTLESKFKKA